MTDTTTVEFALADSSPLGKMTYELKTDIPESVGELFHMLASAHGQSKAEYLRNIVMEHILGKAEVVRMRVSTPLRSAR